jgi:uncharacterized protein (UPF0303 family)
MALPSASDFNKYDGTKFNNTDWDQNVDKTVEILAAGNYDLNVNQITAQTYANIPSEKFSTLTAGEDLDAGDVVRISGGQLLKADNTTEAGITDVVGINVQTVTSGNTAEIAYGFYDAFSLLTVGTTYYVGVNGGITSTRPSTYIVEIGIAVASNRINLDIKNDVTNYIPYWDVKRYYPRANAVTIGSSYTTVYYSETPVREPAWTNNLFIQNKVYLVLRFTGSASAPSTMQAKIQRSVNNGSTWTDIWESNSFNINNPGSFEYNDVGSYLHTGNSIDWDIYSNPVNRINTGNSSIPWRIQVLGSGTTPRLHSIAFYWMK